MIEIGKYWNPGMNTREAESRVVRGVGGGTHVGWRVPVALVVREDVARGLACCSVPRGLRSW